MKIQPLGDCAVQVQFGRVIDPETNQQIRAFCACLVECPPPGMIEYVPAYTTVTVTYEPWKLSYHELCGILERYADEIRHISPPEANIVEIPTVYGGEFGPDLEAVAEYHGTTAERVIALHSEPEYLVYMIGFTPGFPYLGGLNDEIATPRLSTPRLKVPAGSVGIAGSQTGIYPLATPGGWRLIGRTAVRLYDPEREPPVLLRAGDRVKFVPVSETEYCKGEAKP